MLKAFVDQNITENNSFIFESFQHFLVRLYKIFKRKTFRTQAILIGHHHQFVIHFSDNSGKVLKNSRIKFQLLQSIYLKIFRRLYDQGSVTVYEQYFFHDAISFKTLINFSFSSRFPTLILIQSGIAGALWLVKTSSSSIFSYTFFPSLILIRKKLASVGNTFSMHETVLNCSSSHTLSCKTFSTFSFSLFSSSRIPRISSWLKELTL